MNIINKEIERKFLITEETFNKYTKGKSFQLVDDIYLFETVRLRRIYEDDISKYILTRKSEGTLVRDEEEVIIPTNNLVYQIFKEAKHLSKVRYKVSIDNKIYEFNKFLNLDKPLYIAEVELENENDSIIILGEEVTENKEYYGYQLYNKVYGGLLWYYYMRMKFKKG